MNLNRNYSPLLALLWILVVISSAQAQSDIVNEVKEAIKAGSSKELVKHLHQTVDLTLDTKLETYSRTQAEFALKEFFRNNPPTSFTIVHQGASKGGLPYAIGQYISNGEVYRVWMVIKKVGDRHAVHEMSFIKE
jgi:hypothetical protein